MEYGPEETSLTLSDIRKLIGPPSEFDGALLPATVTHSEWCVSVERGDKSTATFHNWII